ncbi:MAG: SPASM domain-containing protein [Thermoleophilia bacterium]|nr:SPASM domain-containing protein [Thermoleophilia bacterium]
MCLVSYRPALGKTTGSMDLDSFRRLVDQLPDLEQVTMQGLGEPLLAPDFFPMLEHLAARGIRMGFNTNATLLTRERAERIVELGVDWLHVSLDGATAATYEDVRRRSSFDLVRGNVVGLVEAMRERGAAKPTLELVFVAMQRNVDELPALVRLAAELSVETVWVQNLSHSFSDTDPAGDYREIREYARREALWAEANPNAARAFEEAQALAAVMGVTVRLPHLEEPPRRRGSGEPGCGWPFESAYVTHDGKVQPCCAVMGADRAVLGDVRAARFGEIWSNEAYRDFRSRLLTDEPPDVCSGCSLYRHVF